MTQPSPQKHNENFDFSLLEGSGFDSVFHHLSSSQAFFRIEYPNCQILPTLCMMNIDFDLCDFINDVFKNTQIAVHVFQFSDSKQIKYIAFCANNGALAIRVTQEFSSKMALFVRSISDFPIRFNNTHEKQLFENYFGVKLSNIFISNSSEHILKSVSINKFLVFFACLIIFLTISTIFVHHKTEKSMISLKGKELNGHILLNSDLSLRPGLFNLFKRLNVLGITTAKEANKYAQENFLRPAGVERQMQLPHQLESKFDEIAPILDSMYMISAISASGHFRYLAFNGQSLPQMRRQAEFIKKMKNLEYDEIVWVTGARNLKAIYDAEDPLFGKLKDEAESAQYLLKTYFPHKKSKVLNATLDGNDKYLVRPNTKTTVDAWMKTNPEPGSILMVSNNPYIGYQYLTWYGVLQKNGWFEKGGSLSMCGDSQNEDKRNRLAVILDNVARTLYTELSNSKK
ncbi:hypothetical protein TRFO_07973 [Tritrichomonas foetus]|uniref:Uncharacterized protein n=1 Tax=Tritrichomonas foetus TaxID=1144522 RepID=A0A1J4JS09_9EUKA|nr:hypothetical protein TRFO_07973 [Tritrichomonas foetus]|eukprot:OHT00310.1 hypothetical protein TRFO_07973 [Tritrichomonas foetus]